MLTLLLVLVTNAIVPAQAAKLKYGPADKPRATPIAQRTEYFRRAPAPDYWALSGYYVPQFNGAACSVASVAMVLNAARATLEEEGKLKRSADDKLVLQTEILDKVKAVDWKSRITGVKRTGLTLDQLGEATTVAFRTYGISDAKVRVVHADPANKTAVAEFRRDLEANEKSARGFIIVNFLQSAATDDSDSGHIAPLGAYDAKSDQVLVMDPDRDYYEPYWVSAETLFSGMATGDGPKTRGYVIVEF